MQRFTPALERLSRGGMSEDESDHASEDERDRGQGEDEDYTSALEHLSRGEMSEGESDHACQGERDRRAQGKDEEDHIPQPRSKRRCYKVTKMQWRSMEVTKWLRTMDLVYVGTKFHEDNTAVPGNQFRLRYPSDKTQIGRPITGLPHNFYTPAWLQTLSPEQLAVLDVQPEIDINFTLNERKYVPFTLSELKVKLC